MAIYSKQESAILAIWNNSFSGKIIFLVLNFQVFNFARSKKNRISEF